MKLSHSHSALLTLLFACTAWLGTTHAIAMDCGSTSLGSAVSYRLQAILDDSDFPATRHRGRLSDYEISGMNCVLTGARLAHCTLQAKTQHTYVSEGKNAYKLLKALKSACSDSAGTVHEKQTVLEKGTWTAEHVDCTFGTIHMPTGGNGGFAISHSPIASCTARVNH